MLSVRHAAKYSSAATFYHKIVIFFTILTSPPMRLEDPAASVLSGLFGLTKTMATAASYRRVVAASQTTALNG
jgi:hypothetical protein